MDLPLPPWHVPLLRSLRLVAGVGEGGLSGFPRSRLQELVDEGVNVGQEGGRTGGVGVLLGWAVRGFGTGGDGGYGGVQVEV